MEQIEYWTEMLEHVAAKMEELNNKLDDGPLTDAEEVMLHVAMDQTVMYTARLRTAVENVKNQPKKHFWQR